MKDQLEHRIEYTRQVVIHYHYINNDFDSALRTIGLYLKNRENRFKKLSELGAEDHILKKEQKKIKEYSALIRMLVDNRNFLKRYLKS
jgi:hypothetical protein